MSSTRNWFPCKTNLTLSTNHFNIEKNVYEAPRRRFKFIITKVMLSYTTNILCSHASCTLQVESQRKTINKTIMLTSWLEHCQKWPILIEHILNATNHKKKAAKMKWKTEATELTALSNSNIKHLLTSSFVGLQPHRSRLEVKSEYLAYV